VIFFIYGFDMEKNSIERLIQQIEKKFGFSDIEIVSRSKKSLLLKRKTDSKEEYTSISIVVTGMESATYSVQVEVPDSNVQLIGFNIPFTSDILSTEEVLNVIDKYLLTA
jgi:hypothetical protein